MSKHYIRLNENNSIIKGVSTDFENPLETDICINEEGGRHFELNGNINPSLTDMKGCHLYRYTGREVVETTEEERTIELALSPKEVQSDPVAEYMIDLDYRLSKLELGV
ncbi:MAG: hypothetical protein K0S04_862 [Herbinix sp.]|jgi:hypothetical protein|nr:hypothetical protein [Herbinix sp.]